MAGTLAGTSLFAQSQQEDTLRHLPAKTIEVTAPRPSDISVVVAREVEIKPTSELRTATASFLASDAIRALSSSLDIRRYGTLGAIALPSFRGLPAQYTTVYRDGIRVTNEQLGETDLGQLTLHGVSRVELVPSSAAVLLGADAIGAVINLVSSQADSNSLMVGTDQTTYARGSGWPENSYYANATLRCSDALKVSAAGSLDQSNGKFPFYQSSTGAYITRENNDAMLQSVNLNASYEIDPGSTLSLLSNYFSAERGSPGQVTTPHRGATYLDERLADRQAFEALKFEHTEDNWSVFGATHYQYQYESFVGKSEGLGDTGKNELAGIDLGSHVALNNSVAMFAGVSFLHSSFWGSSDAVTKPNEAILRDRITGYSAICWQPLDWIKATSGLRFETVSDVNTAQLLPQALLECEPVFGLHLSAAYSRNMLVPTLNALYWKDLGNPNLQSEQAKEVQAGIAYEHDILGVSTRLGSTFFDVRANNAIVWLPSQSNGSIWHPINIGTVETRGVELTCSLVAELGMHTILTLEESYTILHATNQTGGDANFGKEILYSSPTRSLLIASLSKTEWGSLTLSAHYRGHEFTDAANSLDEMLQPATVFDIMVASKTLNVARIGLRCLVSIQNLFDKGLEEVLDYPLPGRTYKLSIELSYH